MNFLYTKHLSSHKRFWTASDILLLRNLLAMKIFSILDTWHFFPSQVKFNKRTSTLTNEFFWSWSLTYTSKTAVFIQPYSIINCPVQDRYGRIVRWNGHSKKPDTLLVNVFCHWSKQRKDKPQLCQNWSSFSTSVSSCTLCLFLIDPQ